MSCESRWASPLHIEAVDPYPWHGLVYQVPPGTGRPTIQPSGGRAARLLPAPPYWYDNPVAYDPKVSPSLWDIGRPDPPQTECLVLAGAESLGRRLVFHNSTIARLNGVTRRFRIQWLNRSSLQLYELLALDDEILVASTSLNIADVAAGITQVINPLSGYPVASAMAPSLVALDRNLDGTAYLYGLQASYSATSGQPVRFLVGVIEVLIGVATDGTPTIACRVVANMPAALGQTSYSRSSQRRAAAIDPSTGALEFTDIPADYSTGAGAYPYPHVGAFSETRERSEQIIGAWYQPDGTPALVRLKTRYERTETSDPDGSHGEKFAGEETYRKQVWSVTWQTTRTTSATISVAGHTVEVALDDVRSRVASIQNAGSTHPWNGQIAYVDDETVAQVGAWHSDSVRTDQPVISEWASIVSISASAPPDGAVVYAPDEVQFGSHLVVRLAATRCEKTFGLRIAADGQMHISPVITPAGVHGAMAAIAQTAFGWSQAELSTYNPMTGQTARQVDYPGWRIQGWL